MSYPETHPDSGQRANEFGYPLPIEAAPQPVQDKSVAAVFAMEFFASEKDLDQWISGMSPNSLQRLREKVNAAIYDAERR